MNHSAMDLINQASDMVHTKYDKPLKRIFTDDAQQILEPKEDFVNEMLAMKISEKLILDVLIEYSVKQLALSKV